MSVVELQGLRKQFRARVKRPGRWSGIRSLIKPLYRDVSAVEGMSLNVEKGELVALIGPNGAGKSTTIKLITGILHPDAGIVRVLGLDPIRNRKQITRRIGTVFGQKSQLWFHLPPLDSFRLIGDIYDLDSRYTRRRIDYLVDAFELSSYLDTPVRKLSLGQRIRCEIAASLLHEPEILFLDEPTIGLDVVVKQRIRDLILRINSDSGVTVFLTSHDTGDIEKICRRVVVINKGEIVWDGTLNELKYTYLTKRVIALKLEEPFDSIIDGVTVLKRKDYAAKLEVDLKKTELQYVINKILENNRIQDITISNPPMEEVITRIYRDTDAG